MGLCQPVRAMILLTTRGTRKQVRADWELSCCVNGTDSKTWLRESAGDPFDRISGARAFAHVHRLSLHPAEPRSADSPVAGQHQNYKSNSCILCVATIRGLLNIIGVFCKRAL